MLAVYCVSIPVVLFWVECSQAFERVWFGRVSEPMPSNNPPSHSTHKHTHARRHTMLFTPPYTQITFSAHNQLCCRARCRSGQDKSVLTGAASVTKRLTLALCKQNRPPEPHLSIYFFTKCACTHSCIVFNSCVCVCVPNVRRANAIYYLHASCLCGHTGHWWARTGVVWPYPETSATPTPNN